jgi:hypothetical protein
MEYGMPRPSEVPNIARVELVQPYTIHRFLDIVKLVIEIEAHSPAWESDGRS